METELKKRGRKKLNLDSETETLIKFWIINCKAIGIKMNSFKTSGISERHISLILRKLPKEKKIHVGLRRWVLDKEFYDEIKNRYLQIIV